MSGLLAGLRRDEPANRELLGPFFLGLVVAYLLWGIQISQSYYYYKSYRKIDKVWLKGAVGLIFVCDAIASVVASAASWRFMVDGWGDLNGVSLFPGWGLDAISITDSVTASIVHLFYAQKIWTLMDFPYNRMCTLIVVAFSCLQLTGGIGCTVFAFSIKLTLPDFPRIKTWASIWLGGASATDVVITGLMTWKLSKSRTGFKETDDIITKIIRLTVETGLATAVVQILNLVLLLVWPEKPFHATPSLIIPKLYSNSMLALLNSRNPSWGGGSTCDSCGEKKVESSIHFHTSETLAITKTATSSVSSSPGLNVQVQ